MKKIVLFLIVAILCSFAINAQRGTPEYIEVKIASGTNEITLNEVGSFDVIVSNNMLRDSDFFIAKNFYSDKWRVTAEPYILSIPAGFSKNTKLTVEPLVFMNPGNYNLVVKVETRDKTFSKELPLEIKVIPVGENGIKTELIVEDKLDPRLTNIARVALENQYNFDVDKVSVVFSSDLFNVEKQISLRANEKRVERFNLEFDKEVRLAEYLFTVTVKRDKYLFGKAEKKVTLSPYAEVTEKIFRSDTLNKKIVITKENTGTQKSNEQVMFELTGMEKLLAKYSIKPDKIERSGSNYIAYWSFSLLPGDSKDIIVSLPYGNYLGILVLLLIFVYIIHFITRSKIGIVKKVMDVDKDKEGIRGVKVILHIKNRGNKAISKIRVIDYLPRLVAATSNFGIMRPHKIQRSPDGRMRMVWDFDGLDRAEERIITYIARSKLSIIGKLALPSAIVEYHTGKKYKHVSSNRLTLLTRANAKERRSS